MSEFESHMRDLAERLSPQAKQLVQLALRNEHQRRFADRGDLPETFATTALNAARTADTEDEQ